MSDQDKTKEELINELVDLRERIARLAGSRASFKQRQEGTHSLGMIADVAERVRSEEALQGGERFLLCLLDSIQDGIHLEDTEFNTLLVNKTMERWYSHAMPLIGKKCYQIYHSRNSPCEVCPAQETLETGEPAYRVVPLGGKDGERVGWLDLYSFPVFDPESGQLSGILEYVRNITDRKKAEDALQEKLLELDAFINNLPDMAWLKDVNSNFIAANKAFGDAVGMAPEYLVNHTCEICFGAEAAKKFKEDDGRVMAIGKRVVFEESIIDANNQTVWLETVKSPIFDASRNIVGTVGVARNITDRKRAEEALRKAHEDLEEKVRERTAELLRINDQLTNEINERKRAEAQAREIEQKLSVALEGANLGVWDWDLTTGKGNWSKRAYETLGYGAEEVEPNLKSWKRIVHPDDWPKVLQSLNLHLEGKEPLFDIEHRLLNKSGNWQWVQELRKIVGYGQDGKPTRVSGVMVDISRRKKVEEELRASLDFLQTLLNAIPNPVFYKDATGRYLGCNEAFAKWVGQPQQEIIGRTVHDVVTRDRADFYCQIDLELLASPGCRVYDSFSLHPDGSVRSTIVNKATFLNPDGSVRGLIGVISDVTAQKRTQKALEESEERYRVLVENLNEGIFVFKEGRLEFVNPRSVRFTRYSAQELTSRPFLDFVHPDDRAMVMERVRRRIEGDDETHQYNMRIVTLEGKVKWLLVQSSLIPWQGGRATLVTATDITATKEAQDALQESEEQLRTLVRAVPGVVYLKDGEGRWLQANENGLRIFELQDFDYKGKSEPELAEHAVRYREALLTCKETDERAWAAGHALRGDEVVPTPDGSERVFDIIKVPLFNPDGSRKRMVVVGQDISARKAAEEALREQYEIQRALLSTIPVYTFLKDSNLQYIVVNRALTELTGVPENEFVGKTDYEIFSKEEADSYRRDDAEIITTGKARLNYEEQVKDQEGKTIWLSTSKAPFFDASGNIAGLVGISTNITEWKQTQEHLVQAARFRAVADLAGGVAHNFNNLLQIVIGNLELALMDLQMGNFTYVRDSLEKVLESSRFGAETVRRLQSFAGIREQSQISQRGVFDLTGIVRQAVEMSRTWWKTIPEKHGRRVALDLHLQDGCLVQGEKNELFEVMVNLIKNAAEAITESGVIDIETRVEGERVILKVRDTGVGISKENLKRVFNPFFTTKAQAGSGLGLASSRKIIEDCGGSIFVESSEGRGTTFTIMLPRVKEIPRTPKTEDAPAIVPQLKILAIDDEPAVLDVLKNALTRYNCEVFTALTGEQALDIFKATLVDLVICDLGMPGMNGWEVGKRIRALCQERGIKKTPFILLTGWGAQEMEAGKIAESGVDVVVEKPLDIKNTLKAIRKLTDECLS